MVTSSLFRAFNRRLERNTIHVPEKDLPLSDRWDILRRYGDSPLAYPAVTENYLSTFGAAGGMVAYGQKMGFTFALGDPIAAAESRTELLDAFIEVFGAPVFVAVRRQTAEYLAGRGYRINTIGHDSVVDLPGHSFAGRTFKRIRYSTNWLGTQGGRVIEDTGGLVPMADIRAISKDWRKTRVTPRELLFLNRRFAMEPAEDVRRIVALSAEDTPLGYIDFDPVYSDGLVTGYLASQKRRRGEQTAYLDLAIMRHAIDLFREEGRQSVYLGISPIADVEASGFDSEIVWLRRAMQKGHRSDWVNSRYFNSRGLLEYKNRFRGRRVPLYLGMPPSGSTSLRILALLVLLQVV